MSHNIYECFMCNKKFEDEEWLNEVTDYNICQDCIFRTDTNYNLIHSINSNDNQKTLKHKYKEYGSLSNIKRTKSICKNLSSEKLYNSKPIKLRQRNENVKLLNNNKNIENKVDCSYLFRYLKIFK